MNLKKFKTLYVTVPKTEVMKSKKDPNIFSKRLTNYSDIYFEFVSLILDIDDIYAIEEIEFDKASESDVYVKNFCESNNFTLCKVTNKYGVSIRNIIIPNMEFWGDILNVTYGTPY